MAFTFLPSAWTLLLLHRFDITPFSLSYYTSICNLMKLLFILPTVTFFILLLKTKYKKPVFLLIAK